MLTEFMESNENGEKEDYFLLLILNMTTVQIYFSDCFGIHYVTVSWNLEVPYWLS